ncbi:anti-repressor SinI family protein [Ammoniphilus sp. 3BR4]
MLGNHRIDDETYRLVKEAMDSGKSKEEFRKFLKQKIIEKNKIKD